MDTFGVLGWQEILLGLLVILLLFGATKLPQLARSLGSSVTEFKKGLRDDGAGKDAAKSGEVQNKS